MTNGLTYSTNGNTLTISGTPTADCTFKVTVSGNSEEGVKPVTTTGVITLVTPFRVLTGDWYHFQDAVDALPVDLQGVIELINGDNSDASKAATIIDPAKTESGCGYSTGAVCLGQSNGGLRLNLADGVLQLKVNAFFTGGRTFKISWTKADGTSESKTTEKFSKGSYTWDLVQMAGLDEAAAKQVRAITFAQSGANGGARIYDMYVRVPANSTPTGIESVKTSKVANTAKYLENGRFVIMKHGIRYNAQGQIIK